MALQVQGNSGTVAEVDGTGYRALRVATRPLDPGALGSYRLAMTSGLTAGVAAGTATAGHLFAWRWGDATRLAVIHWISVEMVTISGFTAAQEAGFDLYRVTGYSASHTSGTGATMTASNKKRASFANSLLTDARIATTTALTAGTHTLDNHPLLSSQYAELAAAATVAKGRAYKALDLSNSADHPFVMAQNEGFVLRNGLAAQGAGGTQRFNVEIAWTEVTAY